MGIRTKIQNLLGPKTRQSILSGTIVGSVAPPADPETALTIAAVFDAVRIISEDVAGLPLHLYQKDGDDRTRADWHRLDRLMNREPNDYQSPFDFRETMTASLLLWGNAYAEIERDGRGQPAALHFIEPDRVSPALDGATVRYRIDGKTFTRKDIFHLHSFSTDGVSGRSMLTQARESLGLTKAAELFGSAFFNNSAAPSGILETDKRLSQDAIDRLRNGWIGKYKGPDKHGKLAVLEDGVTYKAIGLSNEDSQFLETRKFQVTDIARWFRLPPHMLGDLERATFSNIEHQALEYVKYTLRPWLIRWEQGLNQQLLRDDALYFEHVTEALLRADVESRYRAYATARQWGWLSVNEIRRRENLPPIEGGNEYITQPENITGRGQSNDD